MDLNRVLLTMVLRQAGLVLGDDGAERLCSSMAALGIAMSKPGTPNPAAIAAPTESTALVITVDFEAGAITVRRAKATG